MKVYYEICRTEGGYNGFAPCFPGYIAAGKTLEETREKLLTGIRQHIQALADDGEPMPPEAVESGHTTIDLLVAEEHPNVGV